VLVTDAPIFLVGQFRTGSTMFWNLLRTSPEPFTSYYEPFHESLLHLVDDPELVTPHKADSDVDDQFTEYRSLDRSTLGSLWRPWFGRERFLLAADDLAPDMRDFIDFLVESSDRRVVIKFTRASFRVSWLRRQYPSATIIRLERRPRDVWTSMWGRGRGLRGAKSGAFMEYTDMMARDIGLEVRGDPYRTFYALTRLADECAADVVDDRWEYESAVLDFHPWALRHLVETGLTRDVPAVSIRTSSLGAEGHGSDWYDAQESSTDDLLGPSVLTYLETSHANVSSPWALDARFAYPSGTASVTGREVV
jgi:Sulfotransferase family